MNKLDGKSMDLTKSNIEELKNIFPEVFVDGKIDFDKLKLILGENIENSDEKYGLIWKGKSKAIKSSQQQSFKTLRPIKKESKNWESTNNVYLESDNLEALKLLQKSYFGKVKIAYIDPPYNTGKDLIYKNDFTNNSDGKSSINSKSNSRFHSDWLEMMYSRLRLVRNLISEDGGIVIAIDHNELANTINICDEIFGEENRVGIITVVHKPEGRNQEKYFATSNEFAIFYAKQKSKFSLNPVILDKEVEKTFDREDDMGRYRLNNYIRLGGGDANLKINKPNFYYPIFISKDLTHVTLEEKEGYIKKYPVTETQERTWKTKRETFELALKSGDIVAERDSKGNVQIYEKYRITKGQLIKTHWIDKKYNAINNGTNVLKSLMCDKTFDFPKSIYLIEDILKLMCDKNSIVLDIFSGSATTAHAVMNLNVEDNGNRKFIMVQLPEIIDEKSEAYKAGYKNICEIGKERIRRAGEKIISETGKSDLDIGFKVFKLDDSNIKTWDPNYNNLEMTLFDMENNIKEDRVQEDLLYEILLKLGYELTSNIEEININDKTIFKIENSLLVCLENNIDNNIVEYITKIDVNKDELKVVFKDSGFKSDKDKMNAVENLKQFGIIDVRSV